MFNPKEHMINLKGKEYLQVMWRLVWFREEHPTWNIETNLVAFDENAATFVCKISDDNGKQVSSGHGSESKKDFNDFLEKAETKAIGRALAILGYGTQFAPEMDEQERIVDSPVTNNKASTTAKASEPNKNTKESAKAVESASNEPTRPTEPKVLRETVKDGAYAGATYAEIYKNKLVQELIADANGREDKEIINNIRTINAYITAVKEYDRKAK